VIRLDMAGEAEADNVIVGERNAGEIVMQAEQAVCVGVTTEPPPSGSTKLPKQLGGWSAQDAAASWRIAIPAAGRYRARICYAATVDAAGKEFVVSAGPGTELRGKTQATHRNWSEFRTFELGTLDFPQPGEYTVSVRPAGPVTGELFKLLWLCCSPQ
jgi:hypothetical protein